MANVPLTQTVFCFKIDTTNPELKVGEFGEFQVFQNPYVKDMLKGWQILTMSQSNVGGIVYVSVLCQREASGYF